MGSLMAEVWIGQVRDVAPRVVEEFATHSVGLLFLDHKGQIFHTDLAQLEALHLLAPGAHAVADNVVSPGAPLFLWYASSSAWWSTTSWALHEYLEPEHEDWMVLGVLVAPPNVHGLSSLPCSLNVLAWHTDHMRRRSEGLRPAEAPVRSKDRESFARYVVAHYTALGLEALPWTRMQHAVILPEIQGQRSVRLE